MHVVPRRGNLQGQTRDNSNTLLSLVAARNIAAYKGHGLPGSGAFDSVLRLRNVTNTSRQRMDAGGLWYWLHLPHSTRETHRLRAIRGTATPPLPFKYTGPALAKKAPLVWSGRTAANWLNFSGTKRSHICQLKEVLISPTVDEAWCQPFHASELDRAIRQMRSMGAPGPYDIPPSFLP